MESKIAESSRLGSLPPANPAKLLRKLPVVPVRGRWTSVYGSAQWWWDEPGPHHTPAAITKCLVKSAAVVPGPTCTEAEAPLLDEACAEVIARKGRWAREVSADVWSTSFWADVCCLRTALKPFSYGHFALMKGAKGQTGYMKDWVTEKLSDVFGEAAWLCTADGWCSKDGWDPLFQYLETVCVDAATVTEYVAQAVILSVMACAEIFWRHVLPARRFPKLLMWLAYKAYDVVCLRRQEVAERLVRARSMADLDDDITAWKISIIFKSELRFTALHGRISWSLYSVVDDVGLVWVVDTQKIEGDNSEVKVLIANAPASALVTVSSRNTNRKKVGECAGKRGQERRAWMQSTVEAMVENHEAAKQVLADKSRWPVPDHSHYPLRRQPVMRPRMQQSRSSTCIASFFKALCLSADCDLKPGPNVIIRIEVCAEALGDADDTPELSTSDKIGPRAFIVSSMWRSHRFLFEVTINFGVQSDECELRHPPSIETCRDVMLKMHDYNLKGLAEVSVELVKVQWRRTTSGPRATLGDRLLIRAIGSSGPFGIQVLFVQ